ncbi:hypothetical protein L9G16_20790, partial [Shewanella sp. A25]|nr:hypothetical protein [Shewanella shenzhenensis]
MDLALAHHRDLAAEELDDRSDVGPDAGAGQLDGRVARQGRALVGLADAADEVLQARGGERELLVLALADQRL